MLPVIIVYSLEWERGAQSKREKERERENLLVNYPNIYNRSNSWEWNPGLCCWSVVAIAWSVAASWKTCISGRWTRDEACFSVGCVHPDDFTAQAMPTLLSMFKHFISFLVIALCTQWKFLFCHSFKGYLNYCNLSYIRFSLYFLYLIYC